MHRREWVCRRCNKNFPCRKVFVGYDGVWAEMDPAELKHCISPFHYGGNRIGDAEFVEVET